MPQKELFTDPPRRRPDSDDLSANWPINSDWHDALSDHLSTDDWEVLSMFVNRERHNDSPEIFPAANNVFRAFELTPLSKVRFVILGQDPYHGEGQADGLCFSVPSGTKLPPSLRNIFKELAADLECEVPTDGDLTHWAKQGGMMLNTVLTVRSGQAHSHRKQGWENFTDQVIRLISQRSSTVAFVLWGKPAQTKKELIDSSKHLVIESPHPSPLSAHRGFFGSKPFSKINKHLIENGETPIEWVASKQV